jgi:lipid-A-disaccharide synthase
MKHDPGQNKHSLVFISAGEQSGDIHASELMKQLSILSGSDSIKFSGLGGEEMIKEGLEPLYHVKELATVGFTDVIRKYNFFTNVLKECSSFIRINDPDVVILVDYPGFNIRLAEEIRKFYKKQIIYYISPQIWAWHESRVHKIKKLIDMMLVVFPFEVDFYKKFDMKAEFVGHPLVGKITQYLQSHPKERSAGNRKKITILPGSRKDEIKKHMPVLIEAIDLLRQEMEVDVTISAAPGMKSCFDTFKDSIKNYELSTESSLKLISSSDMVMAKAGTSTMECTLLKVPYLIFYKTFFMNYYILKPLVKVNKLGIANLLLGKDVVKEFIQNDFTAKNLAAEAKKILSDETYRNKITNDLQLIRDILGSKDASFNAAKLIKQSSGI